MPDLYGFQILHVAGATSYVSDLGLGGARAMEVSTCSVLKLYGLGVGHEYARVLKVQDRKRDRLADWRHWSSTWPLFGGMIKAGVTPRLFSCNAPRDALGSLGRSGSCRPNM